MAAAGSNLGPVGSAVVALHHAVQAMRSTHVPLINFRSVMMAASPLFSLTCGNSAVMCNRAVHIVDAEHCRFAM